MNIKRRKKRGAVVNTHALNDIMFFLLLFFLILSTLANPNVIKVLLPEAGETQQREPKKSLQLAVDEYHDYYLDGEKMSVAKYFYQTYNLKVSDKKQPMLIVS